MSYYNTEFLAKAALLGHNATNLRQGQEQVRYFTFNSIEEGRELLSMATSAQRELRQATFFNPPIAIRQRLGQGIHDRGESISFAQGMLTADDKQGIKRHFPAHIKAISVAQKVLHKDQIWDVTATADMWGIDERDEIYTVLNVGRLVMERGSKLIVRGNIFSFLCQLLVIEDGNEEQDGDYQIGILPTPFSVDFKSGPLNGNDGEAGRAGRHGQNGAQVRVKNSILGNILLEPVTEKQMNGTHATDGTDGGNGAHGRNGGMCRIAEITIRNLEGDLTVFVQAGKGGNGGNGGHGGKGADGGNGSNQCVHLEGMLQAGSGGDGGNGGNGGDGGHGANGGICSNVYVNVGQVSENQVKIISLPSQAGRGGKAGAGLGGGKGGAKGNGYHGTDGQNGKNGVDGKDGKSRPAPYVFLNEKIV